jgi:hypothetical protein
MRWSEQPVRVAVGSRSVWPGCRSAWVVSQLHVMRTILNLMLWMVAVGCFAQEQTVPTRRILPEDIQQDSIEFGQVGTNRYYVRFAYTEVGAKKMLAFRNEHAGHEVITLVGSFERRGTVAPISLRPAGWTEEGWLKRRTDKFFGVSEEDAKKIVEGLRKK